MPSIISRKITKRAAATLAILAVILLGASWYFSSLVLYPDAHCRKDHHVYCNTPAELGLPFQELNFKTSDNIELNAWFMPSDASKKIVIFVHGHGGTRNEGLRFSPSLHRAGFNLLAINLRRNSNSGSPATMGFHERKDVNAAVDLALVQLKMQRVGLFGFSMGAATSVMEMQEDPRVNAGLFSSGYSNVVDELSESAKRDFHIPRFPLVMLAIAIADWRGNLTLDQIRPEERIAQISPRPVFIMHCGQDDYVDSSHARRLYDAAQNPKELWIPDCNKHEQLWNFHKDESEKRVVGFFKRYL